MIALGEMSGLGTEHVQLYLQKEGELREGPHVPRLSRKKEREDSRRMEHFLICFSSLD